ncbi:MAG: hypothetical protein KAT15_31840, partial [Bacteroidales bacterium]|nr:hypothetical protein [Bacteroidales bacterium]
EIFGDVPGSLNILEEKIDIDLQMEYFEYSNSVKKVLDEEAVLQEMREVYNRKWSQEQKKRLFACLASIENVEAYRFIENYLREGHKEIRNWAILALQESRMLLESKLLDENQVFISTGLGGKGSKLRYFIVLIRKDAGEYSELQQKIIRNEFEMTLKKYNAEIEKLDIHGQYATVVAIVPLKVPLKDMFHEAIQECNLYGGFLKSNFIVTNVRELDLNEIEDFLNKQEQANLRKDH